MSEGLQEIYTNLRIVVEKLQLNSIDCVYACDLKLINAILGISSHSGKHACCYCEGVMDLESGKLGTWGSLSDWHAKYEAAGSKAKNMQFFTNQIHPPLLTGEPSVTILSGIPLPIGVKEFLPPSCVITAE